MGRRGIGKAHSELLVDARRSWSQKVNSMCRIETKVVESCQDITLQMTRLGQDYKETMG